MQRLVSAKLIKSYWHFSPFDAFTWPFNASLLAFNASSSPCYACLSPFNSSPSPFKITGCTWMPFRRPSASLHRVLTHLRHPLVPRRRNLKYQRPSLTPLCHPSSHFRRPSPPPHWLLPPLHWHLTRFLRPLTPFCRPLMHLHHRITPVRSVHPIAV